MKDSSRLIRLPTVIDQVGLKRTIIYDRIKCGEFPKPIKVGSASLWVESEIQQWIDEQVRVNRSERK